mmetsp:Transcript_10124/g.26214  ORF Transcript_10124/g.26214 Transcript_10124/m.26214 type:complete len:132 (+) Transcript_10124:132-527(+)
MSIIDTKTKRGGDGWGKKATAMNIGGSWLPDQIKANPPSIWLDPNAPPSGRARIEPPSLLPKFPETKHTVKNVIHNIGQYPVVDRPGTESYDPVLLGGNSLVDHYPYAASTGNVNNANPHKILADIKAGAV